MRPVGFRCRLDIVKAREEEGAWIVEGYAATTDFDLQEDVITQEAIEGSARDLIENSTVLLNHDPAIPIGKVEASEAREGGLYLKILISKTVPEIWQRIKEGVLNKFSIRGRILEARKQWLESLARFARLIFKMQLLEVSVVSVPANPKARAIRWYIEKALSDYEDKGGVIEEIAPEELAETIQKGERRMTKAKEVVEEEILEGTGEGGAGKGGEAKGFPPPDRLHDEWSAYLKEQKVAEGEGSWEAWVSFCKQKTYPSPYPYPYPKPWNGGAVDQVISILDQIIGGTEDEGTLQLLQQAKATLDRLRGGSYPYPTAQAKQGEAKPAEAAGGGAATKKETPPATDRLSRLRKLIDEIRLCVEEAEPAAAASSHATASPAAGAQSTPAPEIEKRLLGVEETLKGIAQVLGAPKAEPAAAAEKPEAGKASPAGLVETVTALKKRIDAIEGSPADKTSLDGQERLPGEKGSGRSVWKGLV